MESNINTTLFCYFCVSCKLGKVCVRESISLTSPFRYKDNAVVLKEEMAEMGFDQLFTEKENPEGCLLTSFIYPNNPLFIFEEFYQRLADAGRLVTG